MLVALRISRVIRSSDSSATDSRPADDLRVRYELFTAISVYATVVIRSVRTNVYARISMSVNALSCARHVLVRLWCIRSIVEHVGKVRRERSSRRRSTRRPRDRDGYQPDVGIQCAAARDDIFIGIAVDVRKDYLSLKHLVDKRIGCRQAPLAIGKGEIGGSAGSL